MKEKTFILKIKNNKTFPELKMDITWEVPISRLPDISDFMSKVGNIKKYKKFSPDNLPIPNETKLSGYAGDGITESDSGK